MSQEEGGEASCRGDFVYRSVRPEDRQEMQNLHVELFPIRYSDNFYDEMVQGIGMHGGKLYSLIAEDPMTKRIAGFAIVQFLRYFDQVEDREIFAHPLPKYACYILTLGVSPQYRRRGLASLLLAKCKEYADSNPQCGALYLHVIDYNTAAIDLYRKSQFQKIRTLNDFYLFNDQYYSAHLFIYYLHNYHYPDGRNIESQSFWRSISNWTYNGWETLSESMSQWFFDSSVTVLSATHWLFQQFSPELMAASVAQISHHWSPNSSALMSGPAINIEVHQPSASNDDQLLSNGTSHQTKKGNKQKIERDLSQENIEVQKESDSIV